MCTYIVKTFYQKPYYSTWSFDRQLDTLFIILYNYLHEDVCTYNSFVDVKPSNVLIGNDGSIKMCDFGIAGMIIDSKCYTRGIGCEAYMAVSNGL